MTQTLKTLIPLAVVFALLIATNFIYAAWGAPAGAPSAANNVSAPINVSSTNQMKLGDITALNLKAGSRVWSTGYCDESGQSCSNASEIRNMIDGAVPPVKIFTKCSNADTANASNVPCYRAGQHESNDEYRALSCQYGTPAPYTNMNTTGNYLRFSSGRWEWMFRTGGWYACLDGTVVVMNLTQ